MLIRVENLCKSYIVRNVHQGFIKSCFLPKIHQVALNNINMQIDSGEIVGYIGLNGAGKSTTIKLLAGIISPTSGEIIVDGLDPFKNRIENAKKIGVLFGHRSQLIWDLPVKRSFQMNIALYNIDMVYGMSYIKELYSVLKIDELLDIPVRLLSLGQRMRCEFCATLLHNPKVLYLDEPTIGMDVLLKKIFRELIKKINRNFNTTIIYTSHDLNEIEEVCNRIIIIDNGIIIFDGTINELKKMHMISNKVIMTFKSTPINSYGSDDYVLHKINDNKYYFNCENLDCNALDFINKISRNNNINEFEIIKPKLEDIVTKIYS